MTPFQKRLLEVSAVIVFLSGVGIAYFKYLHVSDDPYSATGSPVLPWAVALHVLAAPALVFATGLIFRDHIVARLGNGNRGGGVPASLPARGRLTRRSGLSSTWLLLPMAATGYLLQTTTNETLLRLWVVIHAGSGLLFGVASVLHFVAAPAADTKTGVKPLKISG